MIRVRRMSPPCRLGVLAWKCCVLLALTACDREKPSESAEPPQDVIGYPQGRWRIDPALLNQVAFALERIVVSHREVSGAQSVEFVPDAPAPRSRHEALLRARELARQAQRKPQSFAELARTYSDDSVTAHWGGAMGVVRATTLADGVIDALIAVGVGEVSNVVDTPAGFQIVRRLRIPDEQQVSGQAIFVRHDACDGWPRAGRRTNRTRQEARDLIEVVGARIAAGDATFDDSVTAYSDDYDYESGGDLGARSTYDADSDALSSYVLSQLDVGGVSRWLETPRGFAILRRTANNPRPTLAMSEIIVAADVDDRKVKRTRGEAKAYADRLARTLSKSPSRFPEEQRLNCAFATCEAGPSVWSQGLRPMLFERVVLSLAVGDVAPRPVESPIGFHLIRREAPPAVAPPREVLTFDVPQPG